MIEMSNLSSYVQINIYDRKLSDFQQNGVSLYSLLKGTGCDQFWIGDVPMFRRVESIDTSMDSTESDDEEHVESQLKYPLCSTPIVSQQWPRFEFSTAFSKIDEVDEVSEDCRELVDDIIERLECSEDSSVEKVIPPILRSKTKSLTFGARKAVILNRKSAPSKIANPKMAIFRRKSILKRSTTKIENEPVQIKKQVTVAPILNIKREQEQFEDVEEVNYSGNLEDRDETVPLDFYDFDGGFDDDDVEEVEEEEETEREGPVQKKVSFAIPKLKGDKVHNISCDFLNCGKKFKWRKRQGKMRLVDHVFTHMPNQKIVCSFCKYTCSTVRNIKNHHNRKHSEQELRGFSLKSVLNVSKKMSSFENVWDACFKNDLNLPLSGRNKPLIRNGSDDSSF